MCPIFSLAIIYLSLTIIIFTNGYIVSYDIFVLVRSLQIRAGSHTDVVVTHLPPASEIRVRIPAWPHVRKLVVACYWSAVYNTEP